MEEDDVEDFPATQEDPNSHFTTIAHESEPPATQQDADADDNHGEEADDTGPAHRMPAESLKRPLDTSGAGASSQPLVQMARRAEVAWATKLSRTITIDRLPQESKRLGSAALARMPSEEGIGRKALALLLKPKTWAPAADGSFPLTADEVVRLCDLTQEIFEAEPTLLQLSAPIKVFGDLHGQYADLMRIFAQFGSPSREADGGDISVVDVSAAPPPTRAQRATRSAQRATRNAPTTTRLPCTRTRTSSPAHAHVRLPLAPRSISFSATT